VELEPVTHTCSRLTSIESNLELVLALSCGDEGEVDLLGDKLEGSVNLVLAPAGHMASDSCAIAEDVVELVVTGGQTGGVDVGVVQVDVPVDSEESDVVAESGGAHARVLQDPDDGVLLVLLLLGGIESRCIPFTNSHFQQIVDSNVLQLVCSGENLPCGDIVVVAGVVGDDGAGSDKVIVLVEKDTRPWELSWRGLSVLEARDWSGIVPGSAFLGSVDWSLVTSLGPGLLAVGVQLLAGLLGRGVGGQTLGVTLEHREVEVGGVAAGLVASWAALEDVEVRWLGRRSVDNSGVNQTLTYKVFDSIEVKTVLISGDTTALILRGTLWNWSWNTCRSWSSSNTWSSRNSSTGTASKLSQGSTSSLRLGGWTEAEVGCQQTQSWVGII